MVPNVWIEITVVAKYLEFCWETMMVDDLVIRKDANDKLTTRLSSRKWFSRTVNRIFLREMMLSKQESFMLSVIIICECICICIYICICGMFCR